MNFRLRLGLATLVCVSLASCYPYDESQHNKRVTQAPTKTTPPTGAVKTEQTPPTQAPQNLTTTTPGLTPPVTPPTNPATTTPPVDQPKPPVEKREYAFANKVPGKDGYVFSPYNNKIVDVSGIPSGTLVQDPTYPASEKKYFRVP